MKHIYLTIAFALVSAFTLSATTSVNSADSAYRARNYVLAAQLYEEMLAEQPDADVYYNLGNARWRMQDTARAICSYHRALALAPSHADARFNLDYCQLKLQDHFSAPSSMFFTVLLRRMVEGRSVSFWLTMGCLSFVLLLFGWALWRHAARTWTVRIGLTIFILGLVLTLCTNGMAVWRKAIENADDKAVIARSVDLHREASVSSPTVCPIHVGTTVQTIHRGRDGWTQVSLPDGRSGWVAEESLLFVRRTAGAEK